MIATRPVEKRTGTKAQAGSDLSQKELSPRLNEIFRLMERTGAETVNVTIQQINKGGKDTETLGRSEEAGRWSSSVNAFQPAPSDTKGMRIVAARGAWLPEYYFYYPKLDELERDERKYIEANAGKGEADRSYCAIRLRILPDNTRAIEFVERGGATPILPALVPTSNWRWITAGVYVKPEDAAAAINDMASKWGIGITMQAFDATLENGVYSYKFVTEERMKEHDGLQRAIQNAGKHADEFDRTFREIQVSAHGQERGKRLPDATGSLASYKTNGEEGGKNAESDAQEATPVADEKVSEPAAESTQAGANAPKRTGMIKKIIGYSTIVFVAAALAIFGIREFHLPKPAPKKHITVLDMKTDDGKTVRDALNGLGYNVAGVDSALKAAGSKDSTQLSNEIREMLRKKGIEITGGH